MIQQAVDVTLWNQFLEHKLPFYLNHVSESFELQLHRHDFTEMAYVSEGSGFHHVNGHTHSVAKGDFLIVPIGTSHVFRPAGTRSADKLVVYNCVFKPEQLAENLSNYPGYDSLQQASTMLQLTADPNVDWRCVKDVYGRLGGIIRAMHHEYVLREPGYIPQLYSLFIELMVHLQRHHQPAEHHAVRHLQPSLQAILLYVDANFTMPLTAKSVAALAGLSERHFHRLFKQGTRTTFNHYLQNRRIEKCCELLATTSLPVQEIMLQSGYQDKQYFLQLFKKKTGHTPRQYRQNL